MIIDCDSCEVRGVACGDCVVTALLGAPPSGVHLDAGERAALDALAGAGLVSPLRLVVALDDASTGHCDDSGGPASGRCSGAPNVRNVADQPNPRQDGDGRSVAAG